MTPRSRLCGTAPAAITAAAATGRKRRERCCCRRSRSLRCCCRYFDGKRRVDHHGHRLCHLPRVEHCGERHTTRAECPTLFLSLMPGGSVRALTSIFLPFATDLTWSIPVNLKWRHRCSTCHSSNRYRSNGSTLLTKDTPRSRLQNRHGSKRQERWNRVSFSAQTDVDAHTDTARTGPA